VARSFKYSGRAPRLPRYGIFAFPVHNHKLQGTLINWERKKEGWEG